jgi:hypothetical protein
MFTITLQVTLIVNTMRNTFLEYNRKWQFFKGLASICDSHLQSIPCNHFYSRQKTTEGLEERKTQHVSILR